MQIRSIHYYYRRYVQSTVLMLSTFSVFLTGCSTLPGIRSNTSPAPDVPWKPVPQELTSEYALPPTSTAIASLFEEKGRNLTLADILDIALQNSSVTRAAWFQAQGAAANLGSARSLFFPTVSASGNFTRNKYSIVGTPVNVLDTTYGMAGSINYILFNFGGRVSQADEAKYAMVAANLSQNTAIQNVILQTESVYYQYLAARSLLAAEEASFKEAKESLDAAEARHNSGVATIADVLQAKTAFSQAKLARDNTQGQVETIRGGLAASMGLPANIQFDVTDLLPESIPVDAASETVDGLIKEAEAKRPDLAAARAQVMSSGYHVHSVLAQGMPSLALNGSASRTYLYGIAGAPYYDNYSAAVVLEFPLFSGFSTSYNVLAAKNYTKTAREQAESLRQAVILEVWNSYYALKTATQAVKTSEDLLASAQQSEDVALARYKAGVGSIIDLLTAQSALASARAQEIQARANWFISMAQLGHDTGMLGPEAPGLNVPVIKSGMDTENGGNNNNEK